MMRKGLIALACCLALAGGVAHAQTAAMPDAKAVQTALNSNGASLKVDGKMGKATRAALRKFQASKNLPKTGKADAATTKALGL